MAATILIIDDDQSLNNMLAEMLQAAGFKVLQEFRGSRGVQTAIRRKPDVVLLDAKTDDVQGIEALHILRARRIPTRVIVFTGESGSHADVVQFVRAGASNYIVKGEDPGAVINAVERTLALDPTLDTQGSHGASRLGARLSELEAENALLKKAAARQDLVCVGSRAVQVALVISLLGSFRYFDIVRLEGPSGLAIVGGVLGALFLPVDRLVKMTVSAFGGGAKLEVAQQTEQSSIERRAA